MSALCALDAAGLIAADTQTCRKARAFLARLAGSAGMERSARGFAMHSHLEPSRLARRSRPRFGPGYRPTARFAHVCDGFNEGSYRGTEVEPC